MKYLVLLICITLFLSVGILEVVAAPRTLQVQGYYSCPAVNPNLCQVKGGKGFTISREQSGTYHIYVDPPFAAPPSYCEVHAMSNGSNMPIAQCSIDPSDSNPQGHLIVFCNHLVSWHVDQCGGSSGPPCDVHGEYGSYDAPFFFRCDQ